MSEGLGLPERLSNIKSLDTAKAANSNQPIPIAIGMGHMRLTLNGRIYEQDRVLPYEHIRFNSR